MNEDVKKRIETMIDKRYKFTLRSHMEFSDASVIPFIGLIPMAKIKSDRMKYYKKFQIDLKILADKAGVSQDEIRNYLLDILDEARARQEGGTEQIIVNVLYELGTSINKKIDKWAHNKDYALKPKKVSKIWEEDFRIVDKTDNSAIENS